MKADPTINVNLLHEHAELATGMRLGAYKVLRKIGEGAMGAVYEVEHAMLHQRFALKTLFIQGDNDIERQDCADRFLQEARVTAQLHHENIVSVQTLDRDSETGILYFVMDYVAMSNKRRNALLHAAFGEHPLECWDAAPEATVTGGSVSLSLDDLVEYGHRINRSIHPVLVRRIVMDVASALDYAHHVGQGVIHRDIKPANILIRPDGHAMVADFGVAKVSDSSLRKRLMNGQDRSLSLRMQTNGAAYHLVLGTLDYMAPELRSGSPPSPQTDLFALGVTMHQLLTGEIFSGEILLPSTPPLNERWKVIMASCLHADPQRRYRSLGDLYTALARMRSCYQMPWCRLVRRVAVGVGIFIGLVCIYGVWLASLFQPQPSPHEGAYVPHFVVREEKAPASTEAKPIENIAAKPVEAPKVAPVETPKAVIHPSHPVVPLATFLTKKRLTLPEVMSNFKVQEDATNRKLLHLVAYMDDDTDVALQPIPGYTLNVRAEAFKGATIDNLYVNLASITYEKDAFKGATLRDVWYNIDGGFIPRNAFGDSVPAFWDMEWNNACEAIDGALYYPSKNDYYLFDYQQDAERIVVPARVQGMSVRLLAGCFDRAKHLKHLSFDSAALASEENKRFLLEIIDKKMIEHHQLESVEVPYITGRMMSWLKANHLDYNPEKKTIVRSQRD